MTIIRFFAEGLPKGQPRPKAFSRGGHARVYDPGTAEGWKAQIAVAAKEKRPAAPLSGPLLVRLSFYFPRPKAHYRGGKCTGEALRETAPLYHTSKPDADNAAKAVFDCLTMLGMWGDDAQIAHADIVKLYVNHTNQARPGCLIEIAPLD